MLLADPLLLDSSGLLLHLPLGPYAAQPAFFRASSGLPLFSCGSAAVILCCDAVVSHSRALTLLTALTCPLLGFVLPFVHWLGNLLFG